MVDEGGSTRLRAAIPDDLGLFTVEKGSVALDGVSLTVTSVSPLGEHPAWLEVVLIPHTRQLTVLGNRVPGDSVNIEVDVMAKYVARMVEAYR